MTLNKPPEDDVGAIRALIDDFIAERLKPKLEGIEKDISKAESEVDFDEAKLEKLHDKREEILLYYQHDNWIKDAARRVSQISMVTHGIKFTHPDAKGSSKFFRGTDVSDATKAMVGTHVMGSKLVPDVVGNAGALDVCKFLALEYKYRSLLQMAFENDQCLLKALSSDPDKSGLWVENFKSIIEDAVVIASDTLSKQLYFPNGDRSYTLISPLFPAGLAHYYYQKLVDYRSSENAKACKAAKQNGKYAKCEYYDFADMAIHKCGSTKPQIVSHLNLQRRGENWLLPSLPPTWHSAKIKTPLNVNTVFRYSFGSRKWVRELVANLLKFLESTAGYKNIDTKLAVKNIVEQLIDELYNYAAELGELEPGWSGGKNCKIPFCEKLWLDQGRAITDEEFADQYLLGDWRAEVAERFANWLNALLDKSRKLNFGAAEKKEWASSLEKSLNMFRLEVEYE